MRKAWSKLAALEDPPLRPLKETQEAWLRAFLARNSDTAYGRALGWRKDMDRQGFRQATPLETYEDLRPWIARIQAGEPHVRFHGSPVAFEATGGSTGGAKVLPISAEGLADLRTALRPWLGRLVRDSDLREGRAYLGEDAAQALGALSILPPWITELRDPAAWRLATLHALLRAEDLAFVSLWSPTLLLGFLDDLRAANPLLERALTQGLEVEGHPLPPDPAALSHLRRYRTSEDARALWPRLRLLSAWGDGSSAPFAEALRARLPQAAFEAKGLMATEGLATLPWPGGAPRLAAEAALFEFLDEEGAPCWADELRPGQAYELVITTGSGLARHRLGDRVRCEGFAGDRPRLRFLGRLGLTCDLAGEKLSEAFVAQCLSDLPGFRMLVPRLHPHPGYLLVRDTAPDEALLAEVDSRLRANPQYAHARRMGQLAPLAHLAARRPLAIYEARLLAQGARPGDLKVPALRPELHWGDTFRTL